MLVVVLFAIQSVIKSCKQDAGIERSSWSVDPLLEFSERSSCYGRFLVGSTSVTFTISRNIIPLSRF